MRLPTALSIAFLCAATGVPQASGPTASIAATATISSRTSLSVSAHVLQFLVAEGSNEATASIDFKAGVRAMPGVDIELIAESAIVPGGAPSGPALDPALLYQGEGEGTTAGVLPSGVPGVMASWSGGGQRQGRIVFTLQGVAPGTYSIPVRLFVNAP
jgi:hypothetical protein